MILQSLAKLAQREGLEDNPSYEVREVHWVIALKADGRFIALESLLQKPAGRRRAAGMKTRIPRQTGRTSGPEAQFLVDKAEYVLGLGGGPDQKLKERQGLFTEEVRRAAQATGDEGLLAVLQFLSEEREVEKARQEASSKGKELETNHLIAFRMEGNDISFVHKRPAVIGYCPAFVSAHFGSGHPGQCLISGDTQELARKYPVVKNIPPVSKTKGGVHVTAIDDGSSAYHSYGWKGNQNSPLSVTGAFAYVDALNRLLDSNYPDPRDPNVRLPEQRVQLSDDTVAVFWTDEDSPVPAAIVPAVGGGDLEAMAALGIDPAVLAGWRSAAGGSGQEPVSTEPLRAAHHAPWTGIRPEQLRDRRPFRLLILSGGQGRATVRAFHSAEVSTTVASVRQWFSDLALCSLKGRPALYRLLAALAVRGDRKNLPPNLAGEVFLAILAGGPLPASVLETTVRRCRSEANSRDSGGRELHNLKVIPERAALLKAWLNRARRDKALQARLTHQGVVFQEVRTTMNDQERNKGYLLGRMFACIERMQALALGEVGASITDRYFGSACATPQAVFPRLLKNEVHHYRKAREDKFSGTARWLHRQIDQLATWLVGGANGMQEGETVEAFIRRTAGHPLIGFPAFLPLPEQGLFVLGYHQQRAEFFTKHEATEEPTPEDETQPVGAEG